MYVSRVDAEEAVALWVFDDCTPDEWDVHFQDLRDYTAACKRAGKRGASLIIGRNFARPNAKSRAELTRLTDSPEFDSYVAFVNPNAALRAIVAMFGWMQKAPKYEMDFFGSSATALAWLEKKRDTKLTKLAALRAEVLAHYEKTTGRALP